MRCQILLIHRRAASIGWANNRIEPATTQNRLELLASSLPPRARQYLLSVAAVLIAIGIGLPLAAMLFGAANDTVKQRQLALRLYSDASESVVGVGVDKGGGDNASMHSRSSESCLHELPPPLWSNRLRESVEFNNHQSPSFMPMLANIEGFVTNHPILVTIGLAFVSPLLAQFSVRGACWWLLRRYKGQMDAFAARRADTQPRPNWRHQGQPQTASANEIVARLQSVSKTAKRAELAEQHSKAEVHPSGEMPSLTWRDLKRRRLAAAGVMPVDEVAASILSASEGPVLTDAQETSVMSTYSGSPNTEDNHLSQSTTAIEKLRTRAGTPANMSPTLIFIPTIVAGQQEGPRPGAALIAISQMDGGNLPRYSILLSLVIATLAVSATAIVVCLARGGEETERSSKLISESKRVHARLR